MTIPLVVLAVLSLVGGWVGLPERVALGQRRSAASSRPSPATRTSPRAPAASSWPLMLDGDGARRPPAPRFAYVFYVRLPGLPAVARAGG